MSRSAQINSLEEVTRSVSREKHAMCASPQEPALSDSREKLARNDARKSVVQRESRENIVRSKSRKRKARSIYRTIRARRDALRRLSDEELLSGLRNLHGDERAAQLDILLYFIEINRRRLYVPMGYGSLFEFCVDKYRYSRSTAWRRVSAARCIDRFPHVAEMFLAGEVNLCAISMISGILTRENAGEILSWVGGKSIKDIEMLVARYRPEKIIRDRVKPVFILNPDTGNGAGIAPGCINAPSGGDNANASFNIETACKASFTSEPGNTNSSFNIETERKPDCESAPGAGSDPPSSGNDIPGSSPAAEPERVVVTKKYKISFAVEPKFMQDLERIRSLLSTKHPKGIKFEELFSVLIKYYLDHNDPESRIKKRSQRREKKKKRDIEKGASARNKKPAGGDNNAGGGDQGEASNQCSESGDRGDTGKKSKKRRGARRGGAKTGHAERTRHIPQALRDQVFVRDGGRCTYVGTGGKRCDETRNLQIDHVFPYAKGGDHSPENLRLLCPKHNRLAAEKEYGKDHMEKFYKRE